MSWRDELTAPRPAHPEITADRYGQPLQAGELIQVSFHGTVYRAADVEHLTDEEFRALGAALQQEAAR